MRLPPNRSPTAAPRPTFWVPAPTATWWGDVAGGLAGAIVNLTFAVSLGLLAFAPLGPNYVGIGIAAGFAATLYGQLIAGLVGGTTHPGSTPRASTSLLLSAFVAGLVADPAFAPGPSRGVDAIVALAGACVLLAGLMQVAISWLGLSRFSRYVPYPFVAGFMCGIAVLVVVSQLEALTGIGHQAWAVEPWRDFQPATFAVGLVTGGVFFLMQARATKVPAVLVGTIAGCLAWYAIAWIAPQAALGPRVGTIVPVIPMPDALLPLLDIPVADLARVLPALAWSAALIATFGTLDTLFAASVVDLATDGRHDDRREVLGHGLANMVTGLCGGVPVVYSVARALASWNAGGRTRVSLLVASAGLALMMLPGAGVIAGIPVVVLAGIVIVTTVGLVDRWVRGLVANLPRDAARRDPSRALSLGTVLIVASVTVAFGFLPALIVGVALSALLMMMSASRSLIRNVASGTERPSRRVWTAANAEHVRKARERARVVELEGPLFFGSAERLASEVEGAVGVADVVVLDFRRVTSIDATAALLTERLSRRLAQQGVELVLAGVTPGGRHGQAFSKHSVFGDARQRRWFRDVDRALEWVEKRAVVRARRSDTAELVLAQLPLLSTLTPEDLQVVAALLIRHDLPRGQVLFCEGDRGDSLYLIARGAIEISVLNPESRRSRIVTMPAGSLFGEIAFADGQLRSATAAIAERSVLYELPRTALHDELMQRHPRIAMALLESLNSHLSLRLRETTEILRKMDDASG